MWDSHRWIPNDDGLIHRLAVDTIRSMYRHASRLTEAASQMDDADARQKYIDSATALTGWSRKSESRTRIEAMVSLTRNLPGVPVAPTALDASLDLLNFQNGTLNLATGELGLHSREDLITIILPYDYQPEAVLPLWDRFIAKHFQTRKLVHTSNDALARPSLVGRLMTF